MNAIEYAKKYIMDEMEDKLLTFCFTPKYGANLVSIPSIIENKIIRNIVVAELNMLEGVEKKVPISAANVKYSAEGIMLLEIPKKYLNNSPILSVDSIVTAPYNTYMNTVQGGFQGAVEKLFRTHADLDMYSNVKLEVISENLIKIENIEYFDPYSIINLRVQNNPNMNNLPTQTHIPFAELCLIAVEKWIYKKKRIEINSNVLKGGVELSILKEIVDEYSDRDELYKEKRKKMIAIINMADQRFRNTRIKAGVGNLMY